ncbi:MAG TPA: proton extrusion protein PcxA [Halomicronema sp.]
MTTPNFRNIKSYFRAAGQWISDTPERSLDEAYDAALAIKAIENEHFNGNKISAEFGNYTESVMVYFEGELNKYLNQARLKLSAFNMSRSVLGLSSIASSKTRNDTITNNGHITKDQNNAVIFLEKLNFIDEVLAKYVEPAPLTTTEIPSVTAPLTTISTNGFSTTAPAINLNSSRTQSLDSNRQSTPQKRTGSISDKTSFLPRSILRTLDRLKRELDPKAEEEVVKNFRSSKTKTVVSMKFILLVILIPLLTHQITKTFLVGPIIDHLREGKQVEIFLNKDMEEEAFTEIKRFQEKLEFQILLGTIPKLSPEEKEERIKEKVDEIAEEFRHESASAIKNVFSDLLAGIGVIILLLNSRREIEILKSFMDDIIYGLSDSAKAFIIILFTDVFVGFHSPHGWEVILEGVSRHLGLPENRQFIFLFIATFPVILDTVFKYWIFRYLNRISPSAVATYRNMNE